MRLLRLLPAVPVVMAALTTFGVVTAVGPSAVGCAGAASAHHAALVIEHGDGATLEYCIGFDSDTVTGQYLLDASGVEKAEQTYGSMGEAVCQLDYEPSQYPSGCWTASSPYWAMYVSRGGAGWVQSSQGVSSQTFRDGDAEGFRYESQSSSSPPSRPGVCPAASAPTATATAAPSTAATPRPSSAPRSSAASSAAAAGGNPTAVSPSAQTSVSTPSTSASAAAGSSSPDVAVIAGSAHTTRPPTASGLGPGLLAAAGMAVVLLGLALIRGLRQRRRAGAPAP